MPKSGTSGSWRTKIPNFLRNHHTDFQSGWTCLHFYPQWMSVPLTPHPLQYKLSLVFFILIIVTGVRWYLRTVLICISLMAKDIGHFLKCLLAMWVLLLRILFSSVPYFLSGLFRILMSSILSSLYILEISLLSNVGLVKSFSCYGTIVLYCFNKMVIGQ